MRKYENHKVSTYENKKIRENIKKDVYSLKHTGSPKKIDNFKTLNEIEINELILMVFTSLVDTMIKNGYDYLNLDQVMLMKHEFQKEGIKLK